MKERIDAALVERSLRGDNSAFETLVLKYERAIYNLALRMTRVPEDAEDITQTVFVKAYEKLDSYNPAHRFFSWIYRIAVNESINFCKRNRKTDEYESGVTGVDELTPEEDFRAGELSEHVTDAIGRLKLDYRLVVVLKHFHDFSYQEISEVLQIPEKTVKSRLFTARQQLKLILEKEGIRG
jgi:RNA polymerase sigma-70 factor (ECF subfamily)